MVARLSPPVALLTGILALLVAPPPARAEGPNSKATPLYVLDVDSDDADEQADALTHAIRSRVHASHGWSLLETQQSLATMMVALKCPPKPDAMCLQRIGDQIRADRYVWGTMTKKGQTVTAEMHLWTRGKGESATSESYSDNLKDPTDESLLAVALRIFGKLTGTSAGGTVTVHAGAGGGALFVDGAQVGTFENGVAKVDVTAGQHVFEARVPGFTPGTQSASVSLGGTTEVTITPAPTAPLPETKQGVSARKVIEFTLMGLGAATLVVSGIEGITFLGKQSAATSDDSLRQIPTNQTNAQYCTRNSTISACTKYYDALDTRTVAWITLGAGGALAVTGLVLWITDHPSDESRDRAQTASPKVRVAPQVAPSVAGVDVLGSF
jgi:hypothetical protein